MIRAIFTALAVTACYSRYTSAQTTTIFIPTTTRTIGPAATATATTTPSAPVLNETDFGLYTLFKAYDLANGQNQTVGLLNLNNSPSAGFNTTFMDMCDGCVKPPYAAATEMSTSRQSLPDVVTNDTLTDEAQWVVEVYCYPAA
ncbi:hypothetical protein HDV00_002840 [Rhizophlyctis rosea]|nr:hypothetical protein HDV00_002840 [Rhizophlyctis rosea]